MFKQSLFVLFSLVVISDWAPANQKTASYPETVTELQAKSGALTRSADFGLFAYNVSSAKLVTFTLSNNGSEALTGAVSLDQGFFFLTLIVQIH